MLFNFVSNISFADIAYIDLNYILNKSEVGKSVNDHLKKIKNSQLLKYKEIETELIKKEKSLLAKQNILDKNEFEKKLSILTKEIKKFRSDKRKSDEELNKIKIDNTKEIFKLLNPIITNYVENNSISLVIPKKNIIVGKKNLDITNQIINLLNEKVKKLKF